MKQTIDKYQFRKAFDRTRPNQFSYEAVDLLFDYIEELEDAMGEELELDVIAICCEYSEETALNIAENYNIDLTEIDSEDNYRDAVSVVADYLSELTSVVGIIDGERIVYNSSF